MDHDDGGPILVKLLEPSSERQRHRRGESETPSALLRRWVFLVYAVFKLLIVAAVASLGYILVFGLVIELGILTGDAAAVLFIVGFIPLGRLFYAWLFPVRY